MPPQYYCRWWKLVSCCKSDPQHALSFAHFFLEQNVKARTDLVAFLSCKLILVTWNTRWFPARCCGIERIFYKLWLKDIKKLDKTQWRVCSIILIKICWKYMKWWIFEWEKLVANWSMESSLRKLVKRALYFGRFYFPRRRSKREYFLHLLFNLHVVSWEHHHF